MAEALTRHYFGDIVECYSAGTNPSSVRELTLEVLKEEKINLDNLYSKSLTEFLNMEFDYVITTCDDARDNCPIFPGKGKKLHWGLDDPSQAQGTREEKLQKFREVRNELKKRIIDLFSELKTSYLK